MYVGERIAVMDMIEERSETLLVEDLEIGVGPRPLLRIDELRLRAGLEKHLYRAEAV